MDTNINERKNKPAPTIWHVPDDLWVEVEPLLPPPKPKKKSGRPRVPDRVVLDGILHVLRTGCQWKAVPKEFSSGSTCHLRFSEWVKARVFSKLWGILLHRYDELKGIEWKWQSLDSATEKAPLGGEETGPNPTDRGKSGSKRHLLTEGQGIPIGITLSGAHCHDMEKAADTLDAVIIERPTQKSKSSICAQTKDMTILKLVRRWLSVDIKGIFPNVAWTHPCQSQVILPGIQHDAG